MINPLQQMILNDVPRQMLENLVARQSTIYEEAREMAFRTTLWEQPEAESVFPINRRAIFEGELRRVAKAVGIPYENRKHGGDNYGYVMVQTGSLRITAHHVDHPKRFVRDAMSRAQNRAINRLLLQPCLDGALSEKLPRLDGCYVQILHGLLRERIGGEIRTAPFMTMAFPHAERRKYVDAWDVLEILQLYSAAPVVEIPTASPGSIVLPDVKLKPGAPEFDRKQKEREERKNNRKVSDQK